MVYPGPRRREVLVHDRVEAGAVGGTRDDEDVGELVVLRPDVVPTALGNVGRHGLAASARIEKEMELMIRRHLSQAPNEIGDDSLPARRPIEQPLGFDADLHRAAADRSFQSASTQAMMNPPTSAPSAMRTVCRGCASTSPSGESITVTTGVFRTASM